MTFVETHVDCPKCGHKECASKRSDGSLWCFSECNGSVFPEGWKPLSSREVVKGKYEDVRGIPAEVCEIFGIQSQYDADGNLVRYAFKYPTNTKYRAANEKKFWFKESHKGKQEMFGPDFNAGSANRIYLTEGEADAASVYYAIGLNTKNNTFYQPIYAVKSLPSSGIGDKFLKENYDYLNSFKEIVWAGDSDKAGQECAKRLYAAFPDKFYHVPMSAHKDANEFLQAGNVEELKWAALKPLRWTPENFYMSEQDFEEIFRQPPYVAIPTGIDDLDGMTRGIVKGVMTTVLAQEGIGKSEIVGLFEHLMLKNDEHSKIAVCHLEEQKSVVLGRLAGYEVGYNLKYAAGNQEKVEAAMESLSKYYENDRLIILDMLAEDDAYAILDYIRLAKTVYGCDFIFIDHIHQVADQDSSDGDDERRILDKLSSKMARLCRDLDIALVVVSHVNDEGKTRSSRMIRKQAGVVLDLTRDLQSDSSIQRNTTQITVSKNRPYSKTGPAGTLFYDEDTALLQPGVE